MIEIKVADEMDNAALAKIYYDIRLKEFVWEKEVCMDEVTCRYGRRQSEWQAESRTGDLYSDGIF